MDNETDLDVCMDEGDIRDAMSCMSLVSPIFFSFHCFLSFSFLFSVPLAHMAREQGQLVFITQIHVVRCACN